MSGLRFRAEAGVPFGGTPVYRRSEYSFDFEPASRDELTALTSEAGVTSIVVETLQIEVNAFDGEALHVWGYHPAADWSAHSLLPVDPRPGAVFIADDQAFISGVSIGLAEVGEWTTAHDEKSGWVRVTPDLAVDDEQVVLIATGTCLGLIGDQLNSIWVRPRFEA